MGRAALGIFGFSLMVLAAIGNMALAAVSVIYANVHFCAAVFTEKQTGQRVDFSVPVGAFDRCVLVGSKVVFRDKTKTKKSKAKLHMIRPLREYLQELKAKQEKEKAFCGSGYTETGLVCRREYGRIIKPENVSTGYKKILEKNGLRPTRFHDLRHTVGEIILEETGDIKLVADTLRHSNISTTADTYTRSSDESIAKGLEALDTR